MRLRSVNSKDANLYNLTFNFSRKSTDFLLNGLLNNIVFNFFASWKASLCQE